MRLPTRPPVRRLPGWPRSAGPHPGGRWRGRHCWSLRLSAPAEEPPVTCFGFWLRDLFDPDRLPRALVLQYRDGGRWRLAARWTDGDPLWTVILPKPVPAGALRLVWSRVPAEGVLGWHRLRRAGRQHGLSLLAASARPALAVPPGLRRRFNELQLARVVARRGAARPRALQVSWYGRFGNAAVQVVNALQVASALGMEEVAIPPLSALRLPPEGDGGSPRLVPLSAKPLSPRWRNRYFDIALYDSVAARPPDERYRLAQNRLRPLLDPQWWQGKVADDELVVHLRGGDLFQSDWVHPSYVQPPLAFYIVAVRDALERRGMASLRVVSEDRRNPCVEALAAWAERQGVPVRVQTGTFAEDIAALLGARQLVASNSTLIGAITLLSDRLRTLYSFRRASLVHLGLETGIVQHWGVTHRCVIDRAEGYLKSGDWRNTPEQKALMLDYPEAALELESAP